MNKFRYTRVRLDTIVTAWIVQHSQRYGFRAFAWYMNKYPPVGFFDS